MIGISQFLVFLFFFGCFAFFGKVTVFAPLLCGSCFFAIKLIAVVLLQESQEFLYRLFCLFNSHFSMS